VQGGKGIAAAAVVAALVAGPAFAGEKELPTLRAKAGELKGNVFPLKLRCPKARVSCAGSVAFKGKKRRRGRIYRVEAEPLEFSPFAGGKRKTLRFRLSEDALRAVERANGITVRVLIEATYGVGEPDRIRLRARLSP